jgi:Tol biopolymer transport system component
VTGASGPAELFLGADPVLDFASAADGSVAVLRTASEVWSVPIAGGAPLLLSGTHATGSVRAFEVDPTSTWVLYQANFDRPSADELYLVPLDGSLAPRKIHPALAVGRDTSDFRFHPDGTSIVYAAQQQNTSFELYDVPVDGSTPPRRLVPATFETRGFAFTPDGTRVVYRGYMPGAFRFDVFGVLLSNLDDRVLYTFPTGHISRFEFTPDGEHLFLAGSVDGLSGAFVTPLDHSDVSRVAEGNEIALSPDGTRVLFFRYENGGSELFSKSVDDRRVVKLNAPLPLGPVSGDVVGFEIGPDLRNVVFDVHYYPQFDGFSGTDELHAVPLDGSSATQLVFDGGAVLNDDDVRGFRITADDTRVLYRAGGEEGESFQLFDAFIDAPGESWRVNKWDRTEYGVEQFELVPDGSRSCTRRTATTTLRCTARAPMRATRRSKLARGHLQVPGHPGWNPRGVHVPRLAPVGARGRQREPARPPSVRPRSARELRAGAAVLRGRIARRVRAGHRDCRRARAPYRARRWQRAPRPSERPARRRRRRRRTPTCARTVWCTPGPADRRGGRALTASRSTAARRR